MLQECLATVSDLDICLTMIPEKQILYLLASGGYLEVNVAVAYL